MLQMETPKGDCANPYGCYCGFMLIGIQVLLEISFGEKVWILISMTFDSKCLTEELEMSMC